MYKPHTKLVLLLALLCTIAIITIRQGSATASTKSIAADDG